MVRPTASVIVLATNNPGKVREFARLLGDGLDITFETVAARSGQQLSVEETGTTFRENAELKARATSELTGALCLADDSGLEVDALGGAPGVYSARFAGEGASDEANNEKLLKALAGVENRRARFRCVLSLVDPRSRTVHFSEGTCEGVIAAYARGDDGFGYDPIFLPDGFDGRSFGELSPAEKDSVSHRGRALGALRQSLEALTARR